MWMLGVICVLYYGRETSASSSGRENGARLLQFQFYNLSAESFTLSCVFADVSSNRLSMFF